MAAKIDEWLNFGILSIWLLGAFGVFGCGVGGLINSHWFGGYGDPSHPTLVPLVTTIGGACLVMGTVSYHLKVMTALAQARTSSGN